MMCIQSQLRNTVIAVSVVLVSACASPGGSPDAARAPVSSENPESTTTQRAKVHTELGSLYLQEARYAVALEEARIALSSDSRYAPAYNLLALTHMFLGERKLANENFERALSYAPGDPEISNNFGWFLCQSGQERRSLEYFATAARNPLYGTPAKPYTNSGICLARLKDFKAAEDDLQRAYALAPNNTQAIYWLAEVNYRQNRLVEARRWIAELERQIELTAEATWLAVRIERKLENREAEVRYTAQLRKRFAASPEMQRLSRGDFD